MADPDRLAKLIRTKFDKKLRIHSLQRMKLLMGMRALGGRLHLRILLKMIQIVKEIFVIDL